MSTPLHRAVWKERTDAIILLIDLGANIDALDNYYLTPLHCAIHVHERIVRLLIELGADINVKTNAGNQDLAAWSCCQHH